MKNLSKKFMATPRERKKYVLSTDLDLEILAICKELEKRKLSEEDKHTVRLIKSQLEHDWRLPLMTALKRLSKKYASR